MRILLILGHPPEAMLQELLSRSVECVEKPPVFTLKLALPLPKDEPIFRERRNDPTPRSIRTAPRRMSDRDGWQLRLSDR
jgi:hypothetical protein